MNITRTSQEEERRKKKKKQFILLKCYKREICVHMNGQGKIPLCDLDNNSIIFHKNTIYTKPAAAPHMSSVSSTGCALLKS